MVSNNSEWVVDDGWIWHPYSEVVTWNIKNWIEENVWESEDGLSRKVLCNREDWDHGICWIDEKRIAVRGFSLDEGYLPTIIKVFDVTNGQESCCFVGPDNWLVYDIYLFSSSEKNGMKVWDINTGELVHTDELICPLFYHRGTKIFVSQISDDEYKLSRLV